MKYIGLFIVLYLAVYIRGDTFSRKLTTQYNPDCQSCGSFDHLIYTRGVSNINHEDVLHSVVSVGRRLGPLSVILIHAEGANSKLAFNWTSIFSNKTSDRKDGIKLTDGKERFKAMYVVSRLWEFNDTNDKANMSTAPLFDKNNNSLWQHWDTDRFLWTINSDKAVKNHAAEFVTNQTMESPTEDDDEAEMEMDELTPNTTTQPPTTPTPRPNHRPSLFASDSKLTLRVVMQGSEVRSTLMPRLAFTGNSSQIDVVMDHLNISRSGSRFGITFIQVTSITPKDSAFSVVMKETIDDEFTPGIFKMYNWQATHKSNAAPESARGFLQWKPVCYTNPGRHLKESQQMFSYMLPKTIDPADRDIIERSPSFLLFGDSSSHSLLPMNISFGQMKDGFYTASNYTSWTASLGLGTPPHDTVSFLVIMIITCGLGLPFILIVAGSIYICIRRRRTPTVTYERIN